MKGTYQTEPRKQVIEFLKKESNKHYTIEEIYEGLKGATSPGKSTVYRLINKLVEEGIVKRFVKGNSRKFLYQIVNGAECSCHFHLKCVNCGKLIHLDDNISEVMQLEVLEKTHFKIDEGKSMLYGKCEECDFGDGGNNNEKV